MTPSIYTVAMLRAYLQGRLGVIALGIQSDAYIGETAIKRQAEASLLAEVIALCEGIEAHQQKEPTT